MNGALPEVFENDLSYSWPVQPIQAYTYAWKSKCIYSMLPGIFLQF